MKKIVKSVDRTNRKKENPNKLLINQLSKTIGENSKILAEFSMALHLLYRIKNLIMIKSDSAKNNNNDVDNEDLGRLKILHQNTKSGVYLKLDNEETSRNCNESQSILKDSVVLFLRNFQNQIFFTLA